MTFDEVYTRLYNRYRKKRLHQWVNHPAFKDWEVARGKNRGPLIDRDIRATIKQYPRNIVDIGTFHGGIANYLAVMGHFVFGIDAKTSRIQIAEYFRDYFAARLDTTIKDRCRFANLDIIDFFNETIKPFVDNEKIKLFLDNNDYVIFDAVLMLSVDYWIKKEYDLKTLIWIFRKIKKHSKIFYFETCDSQLEESLRLIKHVGFENSIVIGRDDGETKREIYRCW